MISANDRGYFGKHTLKISIGFVLICAIVVLVVVFVELEVKFPIIVIFGGIGVVVVVIFEDEEVFTTGRAELVEFANRGAKYGTIAPGSLKSNTTNE